MRHRYLFTDEPPITSDATPSTTPLIASPINEPARSVFARLRDREARRTLLPDIVRKFPRFRYGPTHDVEALWWVSVYFLFARTVVAGTSLEQAVYTEEQLKAQRLAARRLLCSFGERLNAMEISGCYRREVKNLHPCLREWGRDLEEVRVHLVQRYRYVEQDIGNREWDVTTRIYYSCAEVWGGLSFEMREKDVHVQHLHLHA